MTQPDAVLICGKIGGKLISITDSYENDMALSLLPYGSNGWIGLVRDLSKPGDVLPSGRSKTVKTKLKWLDGKGFNKGKLGQNYEKWGLEQPNNEVSSLSPQIQRH